MVERIMRNPDAVPMPEQPPQVQRFPLRGLCLICGSWIEDGSDQDVYGVTLIGAEISEHVAHGACLAGVVHDCARLPGTVSRGEPSVPDNHLAPKFRTPSGR